MPNLDERKLLEKRANVWSAMASVMEQAHGENRSLTVDEAAEYDKRETELQSIEADIKRVKDYNARSAADQEIADTNGVSVDESKGRAELESRAFAQYLRRGVNGVEPRLRPYMSKRTAEYDAGLNEAGFQSSGSAGGYTVPQGFWTNLQIALKAYGGILPLARMVRTSTGNPMDWPTTDPTSVVGHIVGEAVADTYTDFTFGQGVLQSWTYTSGVILVSIELANDSAFSVDEFIRDRIGEAIGRAVAAHLQSGSGTGQPLGIATAIAAASTSGSGGLYQSTAGSAATVNTLAGSTTKLTNGLISFTDILGMVHNVDPAYRDSGRATWVMNDTTLQMLRSITDAYGRPLWQPDVSGGAPDTIYRYPYTIDQSMASVSTSAATSGGLIFGDIQSAMVVRMVDQADVMRLTERYADARQIGYFGFVRLDARGNDMRAATMYKTQAAA